jgi:hypothetical protein
LSKAMSANSGHSVGHVAGTGPKVLFAQQLRLYACAESLHDQVLSGRGATTSQIRASGYPKSCAPSVLLGIGVAQVLTNRPAV